VKPAAQPVELKATTSEYADGERDGEATLERQNNGPDKNGHTNSREHPSHVGLLFDPQCKYLVSDPVPHSGETRGVV
jgi:hypothetical protein